MWRYLVLLRAMLCPMLFEKGAPIFVWETSQLDPTGLGIYAHPPEDLSSLRGCAYRARSSWIDTALLISGGLPQMWVFSQSGKEKLIPKLPIIDF